MYLRNTLYVFHFFLEFNVFNLNLMKVSSLESFTDYIEDLYNPCRIDKYAISEKQIPEYNLTLTIVDVSDVLYQH